MRVSILIFLLVIAESCFGQNKLANIEDTIAASYPFNTFTYTSTNNRRWAKSSQTKTFDNQGKMHSIYLGLNRDFTFELVAFTEPVKLLAVGKWTKQNDSVYVLDWDSKITHHITDNPKLQQKYEIITKAFPLKIRDWKFVRRGEELVPIQKLPSKANGL